MAEKLSEIINLVWRNYSIIIISRLRMFWLYQIGGHLVTEGLIWEAISIWQKMNLEIDLAEYLDLTIQ